MEVGPAQPKLASQLMLRFKNNLIVPNMSLIGADWGRSFLNLAACHLYPSWHFSPRTNGSSLLRVSVVLMGHHWFYVGDITPKLRDHELLKRETMDWSVNETGLSLKIWRVSWRLFNFDPKLNGPRINFVPWEFGSAFNFDPKLNGPRINSVPWGLGPGPSRAWAF